MARQPKPFVFQLEASEIAQLPEPPEAGEQVVLYQTIKGQLGDSHGIVTLNDAQFGQLVRHMARDGDPFHEAMFRAFSRSVYGLLALHIPDSSAVAS